MSMRKLKHHEQKLLKKVDFVNWKKDASVREIAVIRRYHIQDRDDYAKYNRIVGSVQKLISKLKTLKQDDEYRILKTEQLSNKLFEMGLTGKRQGLAICEKVTVTAFARRRLPIIMLKLKMAETTKDAVMYIE
jgi:U3 small nucleolar ribonucleoprotein protein IMP3